MEPPVPCSSVLSAYPARDAGTGRCARPDRRRLRGAAPAQCAPLPLRAPMRRRALALLAVVGLALALGACGRDAPPSRTSSAGGPPQAAGVEGDAGNATTHPRLPALPPKKTPRLRGAGAIPRAPGGAPAPLPPPT